MSSPVMQLCEQCGESVSQWVRQCPRCGTPAGLGAVRRRPLQRVNDVLSSFPRSVARTARSGQALGEYILMVAIVAVTLLSAVAFLRDAIAAHATGPDVLVECVTPGEGGANPGVGGGTPPGQCRKGS